MHDVIIIGGGISGLSFAHYCGQNKIKGLVLEKNELAGGCIQTWNATENFWVETGAHTIYNSYGRLLQIIAELDLKPEIELRRKAPFKLYKDEKIKGIASQINIASLLWNFRKARTFSKENKTVEEYYKTIGGKKNYDKLFRWAFNAVICQNASNYPAEQLFKKRDKNKDFPRSFSMKQGLSQITHSIISNSNVEIKTNTEVESIEEKNGIFTVKTGAGEFTSKNIVLAAPPKTASGLLTNILHELSVILDTIKQTDLFSLSVALKAEKINLKKIGGIIGVDEVFHSAVSRDVIPHDEYRGFTFHFKKELKKEAMLNKAAEVLGVAASDFEETLQTKTTLPSPDLRQFEINEKTDAILKDKAIFVTGNYFYGLSIEECIARSQKEFERFQSLNN